MNQRAFVEKLFDDPSRSFEVELWDGTALPAPARSRDSRLVMRTDAVVGCIVPPVSEERAAPGCRATWYRDGLG